MVKVLKGLRNQPKEEPPSLHELEEQKENRFSKRVALATAVYAVLLAITALFGNAASKEMILSQEKASDQWSYYQAKTIREQLYKTQVIMAGAMLAEKKKTGLDSTNYEKLKACLKEEAAWCNEDNKEIDPEARLKAQEELYHEDKMKIKKDAMAFENDREKYREKDRYFDLGEALLQIAIVLASISILATWVPMFIFSLISALLGTLLMLDGYFMVLSIPFLLNMRL
ncbi:MAG: DUF4337 domain-containing protein [Nitrospirota bacterium]